MAGDGQTRRGLAPGRRAQREQLAPVPRNVRDELLAVEDRAEPVGDVGVVVEAEHGVGLRQFGGQLDAVALSHAADGHHRLHRAVTLEIRGREQGVDGVLLRLVDEAARVDHNGLGVLGILDEGEPADLEPRRQLL